MEWLNYHHLYYFWTIAQEGGVAAAARKLRLTHSTLSVQLRSLEESLGTPLFERRGKRLVLTSFGLEASSYAGDIFRLGRELGDVARGKRRSGREVLRIGVDAGLPKTLVRHLLEPAFELLAAGTVFVRTDVPDSLVQSLGAGRLHCVLTADLPTPSTSSSRVHTHALGDTEILLYARAALARRARRNFPQSLGEVPILMPSAGSLLRRRLDEWFAERDVTLNVRAEIDDAGVLRALGSDGKGVFPVRESLRAEVEDLHDVQLVGPCDGVRESYYVLTAEKRLAHPAVAALVAHARAGLHPAVATRQRRGAKAGRAVPAP